MCGRYFLQPEEENPRYRAILAELKRRALPMTDEVRVGEIFPAQIAPVILCESGAGFTVRPMKWGFPRAGGGGLVINSRSEKADVTPMFQRAVRERRCLIPVSWFYEWRRTPSGAKTRDKFAFMLDDAQPDELMYLAGLYGSFGGGFEAGGFDGFVILTQPANEQIRPYHDRMPVILRNEHAKKVWLEAPLPYAELRTLFSAPKLAGSPVTAAGIAANRADSQKGLTR